MFGKYKKIKYPDFQTMTLLLEPASEPTVLHLFAVTVLGFVDLFVFGTG